MHGNRTPHPSFSGHVGSPVPGQDVGARLVTALLFLLALFAAVSTPRRLQAQDFRASITGDVTDTTGAVIPGAAVTALNTDTHVAYNAKADGHGLYSVLYILPGTYTVTVSANGFQAMVYNNIVLNSSQQLGLNVPLRPGSIDQQIVVTAGSVDLDTVSASTGGGDRPDKGR
jgi:Carboxypeptidase regulatory-like domain